jgi:hypothetical protein
MARENLIYMAEETTPTIATEGNGKAVAHLELSDNHDDHDYYGRLFSAAPRVLAGFKELFGLAEQWIQLDFVHPYDEDDGETPETFLAQYRKLICEAEGTIYTVPAPEPLPRVIDILMRLLPQIDSEIEQRQHGGHAEVWASLRVLSDEAHTAIRDIL